MNSLLNINSFFDFYPAINFDMFFLHHRFEFMGFAFLLAAFVLFLAKLNKKKVENITIGLQLLILILLNSWYIVSHYQWLRESLPLYHCRIFMWGLVICHLLGKHKWKMFFAVGGLLSSLVAFMVPETDPFNFPHITIISFAFGHLLLFINSLLTIRLHYRKLKLREILVNLSLMSVVMYLANLRFGGNYGFLRMPPKIIAPLVFKCIPDTLYPFVLTLGLVLLVWLASKVIDIAKGK